MTQFTGLELAIVGMAGVFPEAENVQEYWNNIKKGKNCISFFDIEDPTNPVFGLASKFKNYVNARGIIKDPNHFDPIFFNYTPHEAMILDPQTRIFHEVVWHGLEDAGYDPYKYTGKIGLYGTASNNYLHETFSVGNDITDLFRNAILAQKDYLSTRIAYKFNLKGPAFNVNTACSSSLVAVDLACKSLLNGQCEIAVAGGISVLQPQERGYLYEDGMIFSKDGYCRPFDNSATGTLFSNGAGVVVIKRLEDAIAEGDHIYAIIRGSAINNDGNEKSGFSTPAIAGQADVIRTAMDIAEVDPETITMVECHGTGTRIGDSVELEGLRQAFNTKKRGYCGVGSVKGNIGHLDVVAGVAGLIKTALALKHHVLPPSINCDTPNVNFDFNNSPFYVNTQLRDWTTTGIPRRAGVSSFGIGGTNAHVILEEYQPAPVAPYKGRATQLLVVSGNTPASLTNTTENLTSFLEEQESVQLPDVSYTLLSGRKLLNYRSLFVADSRIDAVRSMKTGNGIQVEYKYRTEPKLIFMFPGEGPQYPHMGASLYKEDPYFREVLDTCFDIIFRYSGINHKPFLYPEGRGEMEGYQPLAEVQAVPVLLFSIEYSLAKLLIHYGVKPFAMIGHSLGEYACACIAGVMSLEDAVKLICNRGRVMQQALPGSMVAVSTDEATLKALLTNDVEIAGINGPTSWVISGPVHAIDAFCNILASQEVLYKKLNTSCAGHSRLMDPVLDEYASIVKGFKFNKPAIPIVSCITGNWLTETEMMTSDYWVSHIRKPVLFYKGIQQIQETSDLLYLEIGPGATLMNIVKESSARRNEAAIHFLKHPKSLAGEQTIFYQAIGQLALYGINIDWNKFYRTSEFRKTSLPGYAFDKQEYAPDYKAQFFKLLNTDNKSANQREKMLPAGDYGYVPEWKYLRHRSQPKDIAAGNYLILLPEDDSLLNTSSLLQLYSDAILVFQGKQFKKRAASQFEIDPYNENDYLRLFEALSSSKSGAWNVISLRLCLPFDDSMFDRIKQEYLAVLYLVQQAAKVRPENLGRLIMLTTNSQFTNGDTRLYALKNILSGLTKRIIKEYPALYAQLMDVDETEFLAGDIGELIKEAIQVSIEFNKFPVLVLRKNNIFTEGFNIVSLDNEVSYGSQLKKGGTYVITGGTGGIGVKLAATLSADYGANIVLVGRKPAPAAHTLQGFYLSAMTTSWKKLVDGLAAMFTAKGAEKLDFTQRLDQYSVLLVYHAMKAYLGLGADNHTISETAWTAKIQGQRLARFQQYLLSLLVKSGMVKQTAEGYVFHTANIDEEVKWNSGAGANSVAELLRHCTGKYQDVFEGRDTGLNVVFPGGDLNFLKSFKDPGDDNYAVAKYAETICETIAAISQQVQRPVRILEIGGGSGMLTTYVLNGLKDTPVQYVFTDISKSFIEKAENTFGSTSSRQMNFDILDISKDPLQQRFGHEPFDVIIGFCVVHATPDINVTFKNLKKLLVHFGVLCLVENIIEQKMEFLIWGLTDGWWNFVDERIADNSPLLSLEKWGDKYVENGFENIHSFAGDQEGAVPFGLIMGQSNLLQTEAVTGTVEYISCDMSDPVQVAGIFTQIEAKGRKVDGIFHAAGTDSFGGTTNSLKASVLDEAFSAKVKGTIHLKHAIRGRNIDFVMLFSSMATVFNNINNLAYASANAFLDSYSFDPEFNDQTRVITVNWPAWNVGMGQRLDELNTRMQGKQGVEESNYLQHEDGNRYMLKIVDGTYRRWAVYHDKNQFYKNVRLAGEKPQPSAIAATDPVQTQQLNKNDIEQTILSIWKKHFKYDAIDPDADFFSLGGDSLIGLKFLNSYKKEFGYMNISVDVIYQYNTIRLLAAYFKELLGTKEDHSLQTQFPELVHYPDARQAALTYNQKRLWFINQLNPADSSYNIVNRVAINETFNRQAIIDAFRVLEERQSTLSSYIMQKDGVPLQFLKDAPAPDIQFHDLSAMSVAEQDALIKGDVAKERLKPFILSAYPLYRIRVYELAVDKFEIIITIHHIIADAWSMNILGNDFSEIYLSLLRNGTPQLQLLKYNFLDLALQEDGFRANENMEAHPSFVYWKKIFEENFAEQKTVRSTTRSIIGKSSSLVLYVDDMILNELKIFAKSNNTSIFITMFAAFNILMARVTDENEIVCGIATSGRDNPDLNEIVGFFANTLLMKIPIDKELEIIPFIKDLHFSVSECISHQNFPIDTVLDKLNMKLPAMQYFFNMQNIDLSKKRTIEYEPTEPVITDYETDCKFELTVYLSEFVNAIKVDFTFNRAVFAGPQIKKISQLYINLLKRLIGK
ncbi:polyketide synthase [Chitinophaga sp. LS1]|uniref:polyketide synthase n=1 Tax=Chitinophaga sp. LS1 TaxID=3051176 RepID=UPI002AAB83F7|nr:polyketide synthase [Chitinophaga sp. LS1]WPV66532.1 condensation domain-containing protein [Chitinophaga sp. LS1]